MEAAWSSAALQYLECDGRWPWLRLQLALCIRERPQLCHSPANSRVNLVESWILTGAS
jgi:hypothetical protein